MEGRIHIYHKKRNLTLFEFINLTSVTPGNHATSVSPNVLLFVGGMFDNYGTPGYVATLGALFPRHPDQKWSVMHIQLTSAGRFFGIVDINQDIDEISSGIKFIREQLRAGQPTNIVLMGHSTGCQDTLHYLHSANPAPSSSSSPSISAGASSTNVRPNVQGAILQAPVSDRESLVNEINTKAEAREKHDQIMAMIARVPEHEHPSTILPMHLTKPLFGPVPASIRRWLDLLSPNSPENPSIEDLLSFDLPETVVNRTFGNIGANGVLVPAEPFSSTTKSAAAAVANASVDGSSGNNNNNDDDDDTPRPRKAMLILISGEDECYTPEISKIKAQFLPKWRAALQSNPDEQNKVELHAESKCIAHAKHDVSGDEPARRKARLVDLRAAVLRYIDDVVGGVDEIAWQIFKRDAEGINSGEGDAANDTSKL